MVYFRRIKYLLIANKGLASSSIRDYLLYYNPGNSRFTFTVGNGVTGGAVSSLEPVVAGRWYTIVAWHDAVNNTLNIQVNNAGVSSVGYASGAMDTTYPLSIGSHADGSYGLDGRIDEMALYKRVLTSAERYWLYNNGFGRTYTELSSPPAGIPTTYSYGDPGHKHAVTSLSTGESYAYDANGNMITRVEGGVTYTQTFDIENRLASVTVNGQTTQFVYDGDGNLVKKIKPDGSRTLYVGGIYEIDKNAGGSVTRTVTYYPAGGAMRIDGTLYYVLKDHLGSASVVTDATGAPVTGADTRYYPFGGARFSTASMLTDKLFTGQRQMADLGIYHYGARFYSPYINRFLSADTIVPGHANPQNLNRYSYVTNNPLRYTDPTGHYCVEEDGNGNTIRVDCDSSEPIGSGGGGNSGGGHGDDDDEETPTPNDDYCSTHPASCGLPLLASSIIVPPLDGGANEYDCFTNPITCGVETTHNSSEGDGSPLVSIAGLLLLVNLGALDITLGYGIIAASGAGPLGLAAEVVLIPLEVISLDLTIYAAQMAATGSTNHDPLLLIHGFFPDFLPYEP